MSYKYVCGWFGEKEAERIYRDDERNMEMLIRSRCTWRHGWKEKARLFRKVGEPEKAWTPNQDA